MLFDLPKVNKGKKRVGRGVGSRGAKSGRGQKGQRSRAGSHQKAGFEGGQTPLYMRLPKEKGTKQRFASQVVKPVAIPVGRLEQLSEDVVGPGLLRREGLLADKNDKVKLVGNTKLTKKLTVRVHSISAGARAVVEAAGGKVEIISK